MTFNCITDTAVLSVLRIGTTTFTAGAGETYYTDVGMAPAGVLLKYVKVVANALVEMTAGEKTDVDDARTAANDLVATEMLLPLVAPETLSTGELVVSLTSFFTTMTSTQDRTLAAGTASQIKKISNASGGSIDVDVSPRLRGAGSNILELPDATWASMFYDVRVGATDRWIVYDGDGYVLA